MSEAPQQTQQSHMEVKLWGSFCMKTWSTLNLICFCSLVQRVLIMWRFSSVVSETCDLQVWRSQVHQSVKFRQSELSVWLWVDSLSLVLRFSWLCTLSLRTTRCVWGSRKCHRLTECVVSERAGRVCQASGGDSEPRDPRDSEPRDPRDSEPRDPRDSEPRDPRDSEPRVRTQQSSEPTSVLPLTECGADVTRLRLWDTFSLFQLLVLVQSLSQFI